LKKGEETMFQLRSLIENINSQTRKYGDLEPSMARMRKKADKSPEDMMGILKDSQDIIDTLSRLADERRIMEISLAKKLDLEAFERKSLEGRVPEEMIESLDEAVSSLEKILKSVMDCQRGVVEVVRDRKAEIGSRLAETSVGKNKARTYYVKDIDACFIDKRSK